MAKGRPKVLVKDIVVSVRLDSDIYERIKQIAHLETVYKEKVVTASELIRQACAFVFDDNERLRESFRRTRSHMHKKHRGK